MKNEEEKPNFIFYKNQRLWGFQLTETEGSKPSIPKLSIEGLNDLIFGLALTIGSITLVGNPPHTTNDIFVDIAIFTFSFYILISVWLRHNQIMSVLPLERNRTTLTNIILLFCVSIEPFLFNLLQRPITGGESFNFLSTASAIFAIDLGAMMLMQGLLCDEVADEDRKLVPQDLIHPVKVERNAWFVYAAFFFISTIPIFWSVQFYGFELRYWLWLIPLGLAWVDRVYRLRLKRRRSKSLLN